MFKTIAMKRGALALLLASAVVGAAERTDPRAGLQPQPATAPGHVHAHRRHRQVPRRAGR